MELPRCDPQWEGNSDLQITFRLSPSCRFPAGYGNAPPLSVFAQNYKIIRTYVSRKNNIQKQTEFTLLAQDCIQGMRSHPAESVDLVVTSPPYNVGVRYPSYDDHRSAAEYVRWALTWAAQIKRVLKPNGSFFLNLGAVPSNPLLPYELLVELSALFVLQNTFHWIKAIAVERPSREMVTAGHFQPINSRRFVNNCHEFVFHLTKSGTTQLDRLSLGVPYADKSNVNRWAHTNGHDVRCRGNVWFIPYETIRTRKLERPHPAPFPTQLAVNCIKIHGLRPAMVMLDPFLGIGHAALAAKQCGIAKFIGFDIDSGYVELARKNIESHGVDNRGIG
jgi:site-specific DNA-methyltransferase (adenine-specific)